MKKRDASELALQMQSYSAAKPFLTPSNHYPTNPWERPLRGQDLHKMDVETPLLTSELATNRSLFLQRMLLNIYEQSMLFLSQSTIGTDEMSAFDSFYESSLVSIGEQIRIPLEHLSFAFLENEVDVTGKWDASLIKEYFLEVIAAQNSKPIPTIEYALGSRDPARHFKYLLVQEAPDHFSEASPMARALLGNFGPIQSELTKVFIDEYGYGVQAKKHSTLFESCLASLGLKSEVHHYLIHYLPSSLALTNYFHYLTINKRFWFRYLGALYYTESSIPHYHLKMSAALKRVFGKGVDTTYFEEHVHIDGHHSRMVLENIILPTIATYGTYVIAEILNGFCQFRRLQELADLDLISQLEFIDGLDVQIAEGHEPCLALYTRTGDVVTFTEPKGEISYSHIHDDSELFTVEKGSLDLIVGLAPIRMNAGQAVVFPAGRLHGTIVTSETCTYKIERLENK
jgi:hypothetical protein